METTFKGFKLSSVFKGNKCWSADDKNWNNHVITVIYEGKRTSFEFWGSIMNPKISSESDLLHAFYCFVSDALAGYESFSNFCSEFGYDEDSRKAERIHKACEKSCAKLVRIYSGDLCELSNELQTIEL